MNPGDDPEKRIAELERQLAEAKAAAARDVSAEQIFQFSALQPSTFLRRSGSGDQSRFGLRRRNGKFVKADLFGALAGAIGFVSGSGAALTASLPSSALWTSSIVCGGPNQLMVNTSHYSYKPNQSGTSVDFQCLTGDGARDASWLTISTLQSLPVALVLGGALALFVLIRRLSRRQPVSPANAIVLGALGFVAVAVVAAILFQAVSSSSSPTQMPHGGELTIDGNADTKTIACNDGHLTVDGREMTVTVTGHCARISVDGVIHHITVDSVDAIDVDGIHNVVTYHSGSPKITNSGGQNTVQQG